MPSERVASELSRLADGSLSLNDFFASVSHEAAQPLSAIMALCATLRSLDQSLSAEERLQFVSDIENQVRYLQALGRAIRTPPETASLPIEPLIGRIADQCRPSTTEHQFDLLQDVGTKKITCDHLRLEAAIRNLVKNAAQNSPDGGRIELETTVSEDQLRISVSDQGNGIPHADWERVFNPYVRLDADNPKHVDGKGIGLALVRLFAQQHGGTAMIEKSGSAGTTFIIILPVDPD